MTMAMGVFLLSDTPVNNQIGFVLVAGLLMDTFLIPTCLVPALLVLIGDKGYYPRKLPPASAMSDLKTPIL